MISSIELTVLGLINFKPMHGYKICHFFEEKGIDVLKEIKKPSVYAILKRFEKQDLIKGEYEFDENNPPRKVYSLTKSGLLFFRENLRDYLLHYSSFNPMEFWHLLRFCRNNITRKDFLIIVNNMKDAAIAHHADVENKKQDMIQKFSVTEKKYFHIMDEMFGTLHAANVKALERFVHFAENPGNRSYFLENEEIKE